MCSKEKIFFSSVVSSMDKCDGGMGTRERGREAEPGPENGHDSY